MLHWLQRHENILAFVCIYIPSSMGILVALTSEPSMVTLVSGVVGALAMSTFITYEILEKLADRRYLNERNKLSCKQRHDENLYVDSRGSD